jgi:hypothetical protein
MKKLAILFLLTIVFASFTFAQVTVKGGFEVENVSGANSGDANPILFTEFTGKAGTDLGPGTIGVELGLGTALNFSDKATAAYAGHGDIYLKGSYSLAAGPGTLAFGISTWPDFGSLHFGADYDGIAAGPATLGFGVEYDFNTSGLDGADIGVFKDDPKKDDLFVGRVGVSIAGFSLTYKIKYTLGDPDSFVSTIANIDASYQINDAIKAGVEVDNTGKTAKSADYFKGFSIKPYGEYALSDQTAAGAYVVVGNISGEAPVDEITIKPGLWINHSF